MKNQLTKILLFSALFITYYGRAQVNDINGQKYKTVVIGSQTWFAENLNVDRFRNGDPIPEAKTDAEWKQAGENKQPAWCYYENDPANGVKYGKLYNWYAVNDSRGLAPFGYHIPFDTEWKIIEELLGYNSLLRKMKSTSGWNRDFGKTKLIYDVSGSIKKEVHKTRNGNGTNSSGFSGLPGGSRFGEGSFFSIGYEGAWWSSTETDTNYAMHYVLGSRVIISGMTEAKKESGFSVRCIKD